MAVFYVQQKITQWIQIGVDAENASQALAIGKKLLNEGGGYYVDGSFLFCDSFALVNEHGETIFTNENE